LKNISTQCPCWILAWGVGNDLSCFIGFVQSFKASLTIVFAIQSIKECIIILLLLDMLYNEWKEILLLWGQGKILDGYGKLPSRPQPIGKSSFNCLLGLKETYMVKFTHGLKTHEMLLRDWLAMGGNLHLLTMTKFSYNVKKGRVIWNEIMVFHNWFQPTTQNPHPYIEEMWKKIKLQHNYSKVLFVLLEMTLTNDFLEGKICMMCPRILPLMNSTNFSSNGF